MRQRAGALVVHGDRILAVELVDPLGNRYHLPPGGQVEAGESPEETARRETREESGYPIEIVPHSESRLRYAFLWGGREFDCETTFFAAHWTGQPPSPVTDPLVQGVHWLDLKQWQKALAFHVPLRDHLLPRYRSLLAK